MTATQSNKAKPKKPYKDFPLFAASNGQWAKKIKGKRVQFGIWADPESAVKKYRDYLTQIEAGLTPVKGSVRQAKQLKQLQRIADALERIADALEGEAGNSDQATPAGCEKATKATP